MEGLSVLPGILSGMPELQQALSYFLKQAQDYQTTQQGQLRDAAMRNLNQAGTLNSPSGQDILNNALAKQAGEYSAQVSQQVVPWSLSLVQMANAIQEAQRQRGFQEAQAGLDRQQQMAVLQRQIDEQLRYNERNIPINVKAFEEATSAYRRMYPNWNSGLGGGEGGFGGGGLGGGGFAPDDDYNTIAARNQAAQDARTAFAVGWNTSQPEYPGGGQIDYGVNAVTGGIQGGGDYW